MELLSFRRTFALLILLVVVPSAALSGFGVLAIINERAAVEKRLQAAWAEKLDSLEEKLEGELKASRLAQSPGEGLTLLAPDGSRLSDATFTYLGDSIESSDPRLKAALKAVLLDPSSLPEGFVVFSVSSLQGSLMLAAMRQGTDLRGARISLSDLNALVARLAPRPTNKTEAV
ncbi:MAG TPA: two-component sensor histidine kinase, partial [Myxococcales bacterium]